MVAVFVLHLTGGHLGSHGRQSRGAAGRNFRLRARYARGINTLYTFIMRKLCAVPSVKFVCGMVVTFGLAVLVPSVWAQQNKAGAESPQTAWSTIQQLVKDMGTAVQSKNLHGIHDPSMKIRAPIRTLKQDSSRLSGDKGQKIAAALKQLDNSITDLHSASDAGNQQEAQTALKEVEAALDQLKVEDPEAAFKNMH